MPNRTIYVADADLPIFEKAQRLAGGNLSATIVAALRRFVEREEARQAGFEEVTVRVGSTARLEKRFWGRLLVRGRMRTAPTSRADDARIITYQVYRTRKGNLAVYIRESPDWSVWQDRSAWRRHRSWWPQDYDHRLEVYSTLEELQAHVPEELYEALTQVIHSEESDDGTEFLDI